MQSIHLFNTDLATEISMASWGNYQGFEEMSTSWSETPEQWSQKKADISVHDTSDILNDMNNYM